MNSRNFFYNVITGLQRLTLNDKFPLSKKNI